MAEKRMFSKQIVDTDAFLEMPASSQLLYFHLAMRADDEGFVGSPKKIMKMCGFGEDDLKVLIAKRFLLSFESGVVVIKHWLIHNTIRMDRFNPTSYHKEKEMLCISENKAYTDTWQPSGNQLEPQVKLSKVKLSKESSSLSYLKNIPPEDIEELSGKYNCYQTQIISKADDLVNYCEAKGRKYKNYKAFLMNALKKDYGVKKEIDPEQEERIKATQQKFSSEYAQKLKDKFKM